MSGFGRAVAKPRRVEERRCRSGLRTATAAMDTVATYGAGRSVALGQRCGQLLGSLHRRSVGLQRGPGRLSAWRVSEQGGRPHRRRLCGLRRSVSATSSSWARSRGRPSRPPRCAALARERRGALPLLSERGSAHAGREGRAWCAETHSVEARYSGQFVGASGGGSSGDGQTPHRARVSCIVQQAIRLLFKRMRSGTCRSC